MGQAGASNNTGRLKKNSQRFLTEQSAQIEFTNSRHRRTESNELDGLRLFRDQGA